MASKKLNSDAQGKTLDASGDEEDGSQDDFLEVFDTISDDDDTGAVGAGHDDADVEEQEWGVGPGAGGVSNEEAGGGAGEPTCC